ncbi:MAG: SRPBCC family protein [Steroidobacteraceae bacterium]|nr:SRPBCC family protein [Steroidobacteraceae bacterium]
MATESAQPGAGSWQGSGARPAYAPGYYGSRRGGGQPRGERRAVLSPSGADRLGRSLGFASLGLGMAALLAPRASARLIGRDNHATLMGLVGVRELGAGVGILASRNPAPWLWFRVAGDVMDLALLGTGLRGANLHRGRTVIATAAVAGITALDVFASTQQTRLMRSREGTQEMVDVFVEKSISINATPQTCYDAWRKLQDLPRFMKHLESVQILDDKRSHWRARSPGGGYLEWDAEITEDIPGERISWHSLENAQVSNAGTVRFDPAPNGRGTVLRITMHYSPPAGRVGALFARMTGEEPSIQLREDLRRFKQIVETGEIATTRGQPAGRRSILARLWREGRISRQMWRGGDSRGLEARAS